MKSTVKRNYERSVSPDGTVTLAYKGSRLNAHQVAGSGLAQLIIIVAGIYTIFVFYMVLQGLGSFGFYLSVVAGIVLTYFVLQKLFYSRVYQLQLTNEGLIFPKSSYGNSTKQLAYSDINELGVTNWSSSGKSGFYQSTNVYASSGGTEVKITRFIPQALADAIIREIHSKADERQRLAV
jgi:hypothetical protein